MNPHCSRLPCQRCEVLPWHLPLVLAPSSFETPGTGWFWFRISDDVGEITSHTSWRFMFSGQFERKSHFFCRSIFEKLMERIAQNDSAKGNTRLGICSTGIKVYHHITIKRNLHLIQNDIQITHLGAWSMELYHQIISEYFNASVSEWHNGVCFMLYPSTPNEAYLQLITGISMQHGFQLLPAGGRVAHRLAAIFRAEWSVWDGRGGVPYKPICWSIFWGNFGSKKLGIQKETLSFHSTALQLLENDGR